MWRKFAESILKGYMILGEAIILLGSIGIAIGEGEILIFIIALPVGSFLLFASATMFGLFVEAVKHLEQIESELIRIECNLENICEQQGGNSEGVDEQPVVGKSVNSGWKCPECGEINKLGDFFCKSCGTAKY